MLAQRNEVVVPDNFSTGKPEKLALFTANRLFTMTPRCKATVGADYVLHVAATHGLVPRSVRAPAATMEVNVSGFVNIPFAAHEAGVKRVVYASSSSIYGDASALPKVKEKNGRPLSPCAVTKCANEQFADNFNWVYGMGVTGLRYFNVYGHCQDSGSLRGGDCKIRRAPAGMKIRLFTGMARICAILPNVVQANLVALLAESPEAVNTVYDIACGECTTLNKLFESLREKLTGFDPEIAKVKPLNGSPRVGDIPHSFADIGTARGFSHTFLGSEREAG